MCPITLQNLTKCPNGLNFFANYQIWGQKKGLLSFTAMETPYN